jgi:hypothetical protein
MHCHEFDCREFDKRLDASVDERRQPVADRHLAAHAGKCPRCRQLLADYDAVFVSASHSRVPPQKRGFAQRVVAAALVAAPAARANHRRFRIALACGVSLAAAAAMLLAISLVHFARRGTPSFDGNPRLAANDSRPVNRRASRLGMTSADLLLAAPRFPGQLGNYRGTIDGWASDFPATTLDEVEHLAPGLRPLRASFALLWHTLLLRFPSAEAPTSPQPPRSATLGIEPSAISLA